MSNSRISSYILFGDEGEGLKSADFNARLSAPTVHTGQKLGGSLFIINDGIHNPTFDTVQFTLTGTVNARCQRQIHL